MSRTIFTVARQEAEEDRMAQNRQRFAKRMAGDRARRDEKNERLRRLAAAEREYWNTHVGRRDLRERREFSRQLNKKIADALKDGASNSDEFLGNSAIERCHLCHGRGVIGCGRGHFGGVFIDDEGISQLPKRTAHCVCPDCLGSGFLAEKAHA